MANKMMGGMRKSPMMSGKGMAPKPQPMMGRGKPKMAMKAPTGGVGETSLGKIGRMYQKNMPGDRVGRALADTESPARSTKGKTGRK